jgi:hypothetical protein
MENRKLRNWEAQKSKNGKASGVFLKINLFSRTILVSQQALIMMVNK